MHDGIVFFQFRPNKGIKIIPVKVSLRGFGEVFFMIGHSIVKDALAGVEEHVLVLAGSFGLVIGGDDALVVETENLVVIGVGEFVQHHHRVLHELATTEEMTRDRNVDHVYEPRVMAVIFQPADARMILHRLQSRMVVFDPDFAGPQFGQSLFGREK